MWRQTEPVGPCLIQLVEKLLLVSGAWEPKGSKGLVLSWEDGLLLGTGAYR